MDEMDYLILFLIVFLLLLAALFIRIFYDCWQDWKKRPVSKHDPYNSFYA